MRIDLRINQYSQMISYEEFTASKVFSEQSVTPLADRNILILRDPYNLFASRFVWNFKQGKEFRNSKKYRDSLVSLWKENAKMYLAWQAERDSHTKISNIPISFNNWVLSKEYKNQIAENLGIISSIKGLDKVADFGGGSSFSDDKADSSVLQRWKKLAKVPEYKEIFQDQELVQLSQEIFGVIDDKNILR